MTTTTSRPPSRVSFGYAAHVVRAPLFSCRLPLRSVIVCGVLLASTVVLLGITLCLGDLALTMRQVLDALGGTGRRFHRTVVVHWRLPIGVAAVAFGALLGLSGAIFQSLTRNPLGSPDIIGFDAGSYTAVVVTILWFGTTDHWTVAGAAVAGGLVTAAVVYVLANRRGTTGFRLIIVGIGTTALLGSVNSYLITRADLRDAMAVGFWGAGSLTRVSWATLTPTLVLSALVAVGAGALASGIGRLELGDDAAVTLGTRPGVVRLGAVGVGVAATALVTAAAGPIGFIALVAPQLARRLTRSAGVGMVAAGAMGAALLVSAHLLALLVGQWFRPIPVGLVTVSLGGTYLVWLLVREARR